MGFDVLSYAIGLQAGKGSGGGSSGGGALPAGVYLSAPIERVPSKYRGKRFWFNGELYATAGNYTGAGYLEKVYKWGGSKWETLLTSTGNYGISDSYIDSASWHGVEYNGKYHFFTDKNHAVFDGTTLTVLNNLGQNTQGAVVYQNKLLVLGGDYKLYEWNESDDTWTFVYNCGNYIAECAVLNDVLYLASANKLYKYVNGTLTELTASSGSVRELISFNNSLIYTVNSSYHTTWYRYDVATNGEIFLGETPGFRLEYYQCDNNELSFCGLTATSSDYAPCFIVHIIE